MLPSQIQSFHLLFTSLVHMLLNMLSTLYSNTFFYWLSSFAFFFFCSFVTFGNETVLEQKTRLQYPPSPFYLAMLHHFAKHSHHTQKASGVFLLG